MANGIGLLGAGFVRCTLLAVPASLLVWTAQAVEIPCSGNNPVSCTISVGNYYLPAGTGVSGTNGNSDNKNAGDSDNLSVTNNGTLSLSEIDTSARFVLAQGGYAENEGNGNSYGGNGAAVSVTNNQQLFATGTASSIFYGIYAESAGGKGGEQNSAAINDQQGGNGGGGGTVQADNHVTILLGTSSDRMQAPTNGGGMVATSAEGAGGTDNGDGGSGGFAAVANTGAVDIYWNDTKRNESGLFGISALATGSDGIACGDNIGVCLDDHGTRIRRGQHRIPCSVSVSIMRSARHMSGYVSAAPEAAPFVTNPI